MSNRRGTGKKYVTYYIHYEIFFSHKEQNYDILRKLDWIQLEIIVLSHKYYIFSLICGC